MKKLLTLLVILLLSLPVFAQDPGSSDEGFSAGLNLGSDLLPDPDDPSKMSSWSKLGFQPDLAFGKFGLGLDLTFRFQLYPEGYSSPIRIYGPDWIPSGDRSIFDIYLPKIMYVRYGLRGEDPLYAKLGSISDFGLGNGLIVSDYANTRFLPDLRIFGLQAGLDGSLFKFPYVGFEALAGNLARLDVLGGRFYVRPLGFMGESLPGRLQLGITGVTDRDPGLYVAPGSIDPVYVLGADVTLPVLSGSSFSLTAFAEAAQEMNSARGAIGGVRGRLIGFLQYGAQVRMLQSGFIPVYFDANYDLYRADRAAFIETADAGDYNLGWLASLGFNLLSDKLVFSALLDGPFDTIPATPSDNPGAYPHLKGSLALKEGLIGGISVEAGYEKYFIGKSAGFLEDLIDPTDAAIGMNVHYKTGATVLTLAYSYVYNPAISDFEVSSSLSATVRF